MMETIQGVKIEEIRQCTSKQGKPYWMLDTSAGKMSCWDAELVKDLSAGLVVDCDVEIKGAFTNLKMCYPATYGKSAIDSVLEQKAPNGARIGCAYNIAASFINKTYNEKIKPEDYSQIAIEIAGLADHIIIAMKNSERK